MTTALLWRRSVLPNGLTLLQLPRQSNNTAQFSIAVEYGSNQEPSESAGIAHFLEHMIAGGSTERIELSRSIEKSGGILGFYTDHERMMATIDTLPEQLEEASHVLSRLLFSSDFEAQKFSQERKIILNELAEASDDPEERIDELLLASLFKEHPLKRPVGGYPKTVKQLTLRKLCDEHKTNYTPEKMILILTGNLKEKTCEATLKNLLTKNGSQTTPKRTSPQETAKPKSLITKSKSGIAQTYLNVGARTVCSTDKDAPVLDLISTLLSGGTSSRLFIELREKNALSYNVNCYHNKGIDFGYLSINCALKKRSIEKASGIIKRELGKIRTDKVLDDELERNKNLIVAGILRGMDNPQDCTDILAYMEMQYRSEHSLVDYIERVRSVSSKEILQVANKYLKEESLSTAILVPKNTSKR